MTAPQAVPRFDRAAFRAGYARFLAADRVLLTGHSHQAWPDAVRDAMTEAFDDAARYVDDKWERAVFPRVERVGRAVLGRFGFPAGDPVAFGRSTHELVYRLLTALPALARAAGGRPSAARPRIVTTTSEFHSLDRQLRRLEEDGASVRWVEGHPREDLVDRLLEALEEGADLLAVSAVFFEDASVLPRLGEVIARAAAVGAVPLVDAYHAFNVVPLDWGPARDHVFATAGGYKYAAFGEGLCFLRLPPGAALRPVYTGWFADFAGLEGPRGSGPVGYAAGGAGFAGATFDPVPFYRAEAALAHFDAHGLDPVTLRAVAQERTARIVERLDGVGWGRALLSPRDPAARGGFVALRVPDAAQVVRALRERHVFVDARGDGLRFGPAPYTTDDEIDRGVAAFAEVAADRRPA